MLLASRQIADSVNEAFAWITGISLVFLVGITAAMIYFVIRYSRKRNPKAADISGNTKLEITWIVIPTIIVLFMFWQGFKSFLVMRTMPEDAMVVEVEARQWAWTFTYPDSGVTSNELYMPVGQPVKLLLTTPVDDVVHSFYVPEFRVKEDCVPGYENHMWLEAGQGRHLQHLLRRVLRARPRPDDHGAPCVGAGGLREVAGRPKIAARYLPVDATAALQPDAEQTAADRRHGSSTRPTARRATARRGRADSWRAPGTSTRWMAGRTAPRSATSSGP